jgi:FolB domain-containing protein
MWTADSTYEKGDILLFQLWGKVECPPFLFVRRGNMIIRIKNLRLRAIVGINPWEREQTQEVVLNVELEFDGAKAAASDRIEDTVDYKRLKRQIMQEVEASQYFLIEKLAARVLEIVRAESLVTRATVEIDKPSALRFADSVSVSCEFTRGK